MENQEITQNNPVNPGMQLPLPNSTAVLVLGILSIVFCWCLGIVGITLGIIALVLAGKASKLYQENPGKFTPGSMSNLKAGKICGIIGLCLSAIYIVYLIIYLLIIGAAFTMLPWEMMSR